MLVAEAEKKDCDMELLNQMVDTVETLLVMGEEVLTNKRYVGNGRMPGPWFVYNWVVTGDGWRGGVVGWPRDRV